MTGYTQNSQYFIIVMEYMIAGDLAWYLKTGGNKEEVEYFVQNKPVMVSCGVGGDQDQD
jgi:hypothetical protein